MKKIKTTLLVVVMCTLLASTIGYASLKKDDKAEKLEKRKQKVQCMLDTAGKDIKNTFSIDEQQYTEYTLEDIFAKKTDDVVDKNLSDIVMDAMEKYLSVGATKPFILIDKTGNNAFMFFKKSDGKNVKITLNKSINNNETKQLNAAENNWIIGEISEVDGAPIVSIDKID